MYLVQDSLEVFRAIVKNTNTFQDLLEIFQIFVTFNMRICPQKLRFTAYT